MNSITFIIKTELDSGFSFDKLNAMHIYDKELEMYENILPKLEHLLGKLNDKSKTFAKTIYVCKAHKAIVFEDLSLSGYSVRSIKGFDMTHTKMVLSKLAKFHGMNAVLQEQHPDIFQNFKHGKKLEFFKIKNCYFTMFNRASPLSIRFNKQRNQYI